MFSLKKVLSVAAMAALVLGSTACSRTLSESDVDDIAKKIQEEVAAQSNANMKIEVVRGQGKTLDYKYFIKNYSAVKNFNDDQVAQAKEQSLNILCAPAMWKNAKTMLVGLDGLQFKYYDMDSKEELFRLSVKDGSKECKEAFTFEKLF